MTEEIKVYVVEFGDRKHYQMQYRDPNTDKKKTRSTGVLNDGRKKSRQDADKVAGKWEEELRAGLYVAPSRVTWELFRNRYDTEVLKSKATATASKVDGVFDSVEEILSPGKLATVTAARLSFYQSKLRENGIAEATIKSKLAHLKAALRWAARVGLLAKAPTIDMPSRAGDKMKGRPVTGEEFDRLIVATEKIVGEAVAPQWQRFLRGLWFSGLRLGEALALTWDDDNCLRVDLSGRRPMLYIPAALDKGGKNRHLPITPDFAEFLLATPESDRQGRVLPLPLRKGKPLPLYSVSHTIVDIGEKANVKVGTNGDKPKFASAHDLRRSFGERWATKVMPQVLMELMRHETMATTLKFYVGQNAERTADAVWAAFEKGNTLANIQPKAGEKTSKEIDVSR